MGTELVNQSDQRKALILLECLDSLTNYHLIFSGLFKSFIMMLKAPGKKVNLFKAKCLAKFVSFGETFKGLWCSLSGSLTQFHDISSKNSSSSCLIEHHAVRDPTALSRAMRFVNCSGDGKLCSF